MTNVSALQFARAEYPEDFQMVRQGVLLARWMARGFTVVLMVLVIALVIGEGMPNLLNRPGFEVLQLFAFAVVLAGLLIGFRWELLGGVAVLSGLVVFYLINLAAVGKVPGGLFPWFFIAGLLFLVSGLSSRKRSEADRSN